MVMESIFFLKGVGAFHRAGIELSPVDLERDE